MNAYILLYQLILSCLLAYMPVTQIPAAETVKEEKHPADYSRFKNQVKHIRDSLGALPIPADSLQRLARNTFTVLLTDSMYGYWKGTTWDFYGTTETPGEGSIACGYFVTTVLRDMGVQLDRIAMAETYSQKMIETLVQPKHIRKFSNRNFEGLFAYLRSKPDGIYIIGLDYHTGFVQVQNGQIMFLHSSFFEPRCVIKQPADNSVYFTQNAYFVTGCLSCDEQFMQRWLTH